MSGNVEVNTIEAVLVLAKAKIQDPKNWCRSALAKDIDGEPLHQDSPNAVRWCAVGALLSSTPKFYLREKSITFLTESEQIEPAVVNNVEGHEAVMKMFDRAIKIAQTAGV
jgi:hypothetical protein